MDILQPLTRMGQTLRHPLQLANCIHCTVYSMFFLLRVYMCLLIISMQRQYSHPKTLGLSGFLIKPSKSLNSLSMGPESWIWDLCNIYIQTPLTVTAICIFFCVSVGESQFCHDVLTQELFIWVAFPKAGTLFYSRQFYHRCQKFRTKIISKFSPKYLLHFAKSLAKLFLTNSKCENFAKFLTWNFRNFQ